MENAVEKIYCCDRGDNNLAAAILATANKQNDFSPYAAMMGGGMNGWMNNPFAYLMFLALFRNGGFGFGGDGNGAAAATTQGIEMQNQLNAIRTQLQDNQNANCIKEAVQGNAFALSQLSQNLNIDFNTLQKCCCEVQSAIQQVAGQVGFSAERVINAINLGDSNLLQAVQNCCCQTQQRIADFQGQMALQLCQQTGTLRDGQRDLGQAVTQGFAATSYETQRQTCDIINAGNANTQRIIDTLNSHWNDENQRKIQDLKFELSQERQNNFLLSRLGGCNTGCGFSNGCGC